MHEPLAISLKRVRGSLPQEAPGARGLERLARNPACLRLGVLTLAGVSPATVAREAYGKPAKEGQSPFAIGIGNQFESTLFKDGAQRFLDLYRTAGRLGPSETYVVNISELVPGTGQEVMSQRMTQTLRLLGFRRSDQSKAPHIIIKPRLTLPLAGIARGIEPDVLVAATSDSFYRPVEIKSYPDRDGKTSPSDLRSALRQAAVGVLALRHALTDRLNMPAHEAADRVPDWGDIVLRKPGSMRGSLRPMSLAGEVDSIARSLVSAKADVAIAIAHLPTDASLADPTVLDAIPNHFRESCKEHCALAKQCKAAAILAGDPAILGDIARETLHAPQTLGRVIDLLHGRGFAPITPAEEAVRSDLQRAHSAYREAVGHE